MLLHLIHFFNNELIEKYLFENKYGKKDFEILDDLENNLEKFNCLCIVQHHNTMESKIEQIYQNGKISLIYDCQNRLKKSNSKSILMSFGAQH